MLLLLEISYVIKSHLRGVSMQPVGIKICGLSPAYTCCPRKNLALLQTWCTHFLCQNLWSVLKNLQASCNMTKSSYYRISPISKENFPFFDSEKVGRYNHCMDQNDWKNLLKSSNSSLSVLKFLLPLTDWPLMLKEGRIFLSPWVCNFCVLSLAVKDLILGTNGF